MLRFLAPLVVAVAIAGPGVAADFDHALIVGDKPLSSFQRVYVAPVAVALEDDRDARNVRDDDAAEKAEDFEEALADAFDDLELVDAPGEGVLTIEATLTRLASSRPTFGDFDERPGLGHESVFAGGAGFEAVLSEGGDTLAEVADDYVGSLGDSSARIAIWHDADRAFSRWARDLARFVSAN